jgi:hypothetical protein
MLSDAESRQVQAQATAAAQSVKRTVAGFSGQRQGHRIRIRQSP